MLTSDLSPEQNQRGVALEECLVEEGGATKPEDESQEESGEEEADDDLDLF